MTTADHRPAAADPTADGQAQLFAALAAAAAEIKPVPRSKSVRIRTKTGGEFGYSYATLDALLESVRGPLTRHGLWFLQHVDGDTLVTTVVHRAGGSLRCPITMPPLPREPQDVGSWLTYGRRYGLSAALGLAPDEDDDASSAQAKAKEQAPQPRRGRGSVAPSADQREFDRLCGAIGACRTMDELEGLAEAANALPDPFRSRLRPVWAGHLERLRKAGQQHPAPATPPGRTFPPGTDPYATAGKHTGD